MGLFDKFKKSKNTIVEEIKSEEKIDLNEAIQQIMDVVDKKVVQSLCKKILKKCSFKSQNDVGMLAELAVWLYVYGHYELAVMVCGLVQDVEFDGNYTLWSNFESLHCIKARILREKGCKKEAQAIVKFVNQYKDPKLYKNLVEHFTVTLDKNIESNLKNNSKAGARSWRLLKLEMAICYRELGKFPIPDSQLEAIIKELIAILEQEK